MSQILTTRPGPGPGPNNAAAASPAAKARGCSYRVRRAQSPQDIRAAQLLRFMVFNVELQEGLDESFETCLDADRFDDACDHLLVEETHSQEIVGTYRVQTGIRAAARHGYYSEQEFDFAPYESLRPVLLELGRACVHANHRNFTVLNLLWRAIADYAREHGARYLVGCSSLTSEEESVGAAAYEILRPRLVAPALQTVPVAAFQCCMTNPAAPAPRIPKLLSAYLTLGAGICGPPAIDRAFKTIDFLTLIDLHSVSARWGKFGFNPGAT